MIYYKKLTPVGDDTPDYSIGDNIGGTFTLSPFPGVGRGGKLVSVQVSDASNVGPAIRILFFDAVPTGTYTDNSAVDLSAADRLALVGQVKIAAADYETSDSYKIVTLSALDMGMGTSLNTGVIYGAIVADSAWNGAASTDLQITLTWEDGYND